MDATLRPLTRADIPAWAGLLAAAEEVDRTAEHYSEADLEEEMDNPDTEVGKDFVGAFEGEDLVGYFSTYPRGTVDGQVRVNVEGSVRPDRRGRGIGTILAAAMVARARDVRDERDPTTALRMAATGLTRNEAQADLLAAVGLRGERWNFVMRTALDDLPPAPPLAAGYAFRQYDDTMARPLLDAHNAAFTDHPNFTPWTETMWKQWVTESRSFRPALTYVVVPEGDAESAGTAEPVEIVAYLQSAEFDAHFEATGRREAYVGKLGTLRGHRGRGLGGALLAHCLAAYRDAGYDEASLDVDSENPTGALGLYRRAGFEEESRWTNYVGVVPA